jgi:hypothetical protein
MQKTKAKKPSGSAKKFDAKLLAIAVIFAMLFVSYVVVFTSQTPTIPSKNMEFYNVDLERGIYTGNVKNIDYSLSDINLTIRDSSSDNKNSTQNLTTGYILETEGNFNCTFFDTNGNGRLDEDDEFKVYNAFTDDRIEIRLKDTEELVAYYTF